MTSAASTASAASAASTGLVTRVWRWCRAIEWDPAAWPLHHPYLATAAASSLTTLLACWIADHLWTRRRVRAIKADMAQAMVNGGSSATGTGRLRPLSAPSSASTAASAAAAAAATGSPQQEAQPPHPPLRMTPAGAPAGGSAGPVGAAGLTSTPPVSEVIVREQLARNYAFLGEAGMAVLRQSFVIVVGAGGVGSHAAHMLARAGVGRLRIIDFDQVTLSSLNRHAVATHADVGTSKVRCLQYHLAQICPQVQVEAVALLFSAKTAESLLAGAPNMVLDCIDNLNTKVDLIAYCKEHGLSVMASMGAGAKADPSRIQIADISTTYEDPLARRTRLALKLRGVVDGVTVVFSTEKPGKVGLLPLDENQVADADEYAALPDFRARILPVLGTLPALFGQAMATHVLTTLAGFETEPLVVKNRHKLYHKLQRDLQVEERAVYGAEQRDYLLSETEVGFILEEIWRGRCAKTGSFDRPTLTRWDPREPASLTNTVCLTRSEAHAYRDLAVKDVAQARASQFTDAQREAIEARLRLAASWMADLRKLESL